MDMVTKPLVPFESKKVKGQMINGTHSKAHLQFRSLIKIMNIKTQTGN